MEPVTDPDYIEKFNGYVPMIQEYANKKYTKLTPITFKRQVVAGMNYQIVY